MSIVVTEVPDNLRMMGYSKEVPGDVYNICQRIAEKFPSLTVVFRETHAEPYTVFETGKDGEKRYVARYEHLGSHIIDDLEYMLRVPFKDRLKVTEARVEAANKAAEGMPDDHMEKFAAEFRHDLIKAGFVHSAVRPTYFKDRKSDA